MDIYNYQKIISAIIIVCFFCLLLTFGVGILLLTDCDFWSDLSETWECHTKLVFTVAYFIFSFLFCFGLIRFFKSDWNNSNISEYDHIL